MLTTMRIFAVATILVIATSTARAEPPAVSFDLGYLWDRVALSDHTSIDGNLVRFGFRVNHGAFHFGAEVDDSWLAGTTPLAAPDNLPTVTGPARRPHRGT